MRSLRVKKRIIGVSTLILAIVLANIPIFSRALELPAVSKWDCGASVGGADAAWVKAELKLNTGGTAYELHIYKDPVITESVSMTNYDKLTDRPWHDYASDIEAVIIEGVERIGGNAFNGLSIKQVPTLPNTIKEIGQDAFSNCTQMEGVLTFPDSTTVIHNRAFQNCSAMDGVDFLSAVNLSSIGQSAFAGCSDMTGDVQVTLTGELGDYAFNGCIRLNGSVNIIANRVGNFAFYDCKGLKGTLFVDSPTIGESAFQNCSGLSGELTLKNTKTIGNNAFNGCSNLQRLETSVNPLLPDGLTQIGDNAFTSCSSLQGALVMPDTLNSVGKEAFMGCWGLKSLSYSAISSISNLGTAAFKNCSALATGDGNNNYVRIPSRITSIPDELFSGCAALTGVELDNVTTIGANAFYDCDALSERISIPTSVTSIGAGAFAHPDPQTVARHVYFAEGTRIVKNNVIPAGNSSHSFDDDTTLHFYPDDCVLDDMSLNPQRRWQGYPVEIVPPGDPFEKILQDEQGNALSEKPDAEFLAPGTSGVTFNSNDHTLVVRKMTDSDADPSPRLEQRLQAANIIRKSTEKLSSYDVKLVRYYGTSFAEDVDQFTYEDPTKVPPNNLANARIRVSFSVPSEVSGTILGVYSTKNGTPNYELLNWTELEDNGTKKIQFETEHFSEIGILYDTGLPPFAVDDSVTGHPNVSRASFVPGTGEPASTDGYKLYIQADDNEGDAIKSQVHIEPGQVFGVYDIYLMIDDGITNTIKDDDFGTLSIMVPVPAEINTAMNADWDQYGTIGELAVHQVTGKTGVVYTVEPVTGIRTASTISGTETIRTARFETSKFMDPGTDSEFGFVYTPVNPNVLPFTYKHPTVDTQIPDVVVRDKTINAQPLPSGSAGYDAFKGYYLDIELVKEQDPAQTDLGGLKSPLESNQTLYVYKTTLRRHSDNGIVPAFPNGYKLNVRVPVPAELDTSYFSDGVSPKGLIEYIRAEGNPFAITEEPNYGEPGTTSGIRYLEFDIDQNGETGLLYTAYEEPVTRTPFKITTDSTWKNSMSDLDRARVREHDSLNTSPDHTAETTFDNWELRFSEGSAEAKTAFEQVLKPTLEDDQEYYVINYKLFQNDEERDIKEGVSPASPIKMVMPILTQEATTDWNLEAANAKVELYRYELENDLTTPRLIGPIDASDDTVGSTKVKVFDLSRILSDRENGNIAVVYTPDRTTNPFRVLYNGVETPGMATFGDATLNNTTYAGYTLEIRDAAPTDANAVLDDPLLIPSGGRAVKSYYVTLYDPSGNPVSNYKNDLTITVPIPDTTPDGTGTVTWDLASGDVTGMLTYYVNNGVNVLDHWSLAGGKDIPNKKITFTIGPNFGKDIKTEGYGNGEYGMIYVPTEDPGIEFEIIDERSTESQNGHKATGRVSNEPNFTENRYLILYDSTGPELMPAVDAETSLNWYKAHDVYDIVFQDVRNPKTNNKTDHGTVILTLRIPSEMDMTKQDANLKIATFRKGTTQLQVITPKWRQNQTNGAWEVQFETDHFSDYALLYYDSASNSSTNASTGDSSSTNASTGDSSSTGGTTATGATTDSSSTATTSTGATTSSATGSTTSTGATTSSATGSTTSTGATTGSSSSTGSSTGSSASTVSTTGASSATRASTGSTIPTAYTTNPGSGSRPDMPKTGDPGMYRMMGSAGLGLFGIYELISSIRVREKGGKRRLYRR